MQHTLFLTHITHLTHLAHVAHLSPAPCAVLEVLIMKSGPRFNGVIREVLPVGYHSPKTPTTIVYLGVTEGVSVKV